MHEVRDLSELNEWIADAVARLSAQPAAGSAYPTPTSPAELARLIDHTLLKPTATEAQIRRLCLEALEYDFVTVCVNPVWVALCSSLLSGSNTGVCTVIGFPLGATTTEVKVFEAQQCLANGARELDMVINVGALQSGDYAAVYSDISAVAQAAHAGHAGLKVIIEAAYLNDREKIAACVLAQAAGADYVKTSTGFGPGRRDHRGCCPDAPRRGRGDGSEGRGRHPHAR